MHKTKSLTALALFVFALQGCSQPAEKKEFVLAGPSVAVAPVQPLPAFDDGIALKEMYGNYEAPLKGSVRAAMKLPEALNNLPTEGTAQVIFSRGYLKNGQDRRVVLTSTKSAKHNYQGTQLLIDAATYEPVGGNWVLESSYHFLPIEGDAGKAPECDWVQIGKENFAVVYKRLADYDAYKSTGFTVIGLNNGVAKKILVSADTSTDKDPIDCTLAFTKSDQAFWNASLLVTAKPTNNSSSPTEAHYQYQDDQYIPDGDATPFSQRQTESAAEIVIHKFYGWYVDQELKFNNDWPSKKKKALQYMTSSLYKKAAKNASAGEEGESSGDIFGTGNGGPLPDWAQGRKLTMEPVKVDGDKAQTVVSLGGNGSINSVKVQMELAKVNGTWLITDAKVL